jgi:rhodanese-related sulfurtransferase
MDIQQLREFSTNHLLLVMAFFAILAMLIGNELRRFFSSVKEVAPAEATRLLNHENAIMVDMRSDKEYRDGHVVNAIHAPPDTQDALGRLEKYRDRPLIVYCRSGQQSARLSGQLSKQGFDSVYHLKGGIQAWQQADLPLSKGK